MVDTGLIQTEDGPGPKPSHPKPSWKRATSDQKTQYKNNLENALNQITVPEALSNCQDVHFDNPTHCEEADNLIIEILQSVERSAYENLPVPAPPKPKRKRSNLPGWSDEVHPFRENAYFWHQVWDSAGRPINTQLHHII